MHSMQEMKKRKKENYNILWPKYRVHRWIQPFLTAIFSMEVKITSDIFLHPYVTPISPSSFQNQ